MIRKTPSGIRRKLSGSGLRLLGSGHSGATIVTTEEAVVERDSEVDTLFSSLRKESADIVATRLSQQILDLVALSREFETPPQPVWDAVSQRRIITATQAVQDSLGKLMLTLKLGLPGSADPSAGFSTRLQESLAGELAAVWKACSNASALFTADSRAVLAEQAARHPQPVDLRHAVERSAGDLRFMATRYLRRVCELLLTLQDILAKNKDRFATLRPSSSSTPSARPLY